MKKLFIIFAFLFGLSLTSFSQTVQAPVTAEQKADEVVNKMKDNLSLTDEQIPAIKGITIERIKKVTEARKKYGADKQRIQASNKLILEEWESQLKEILTTDQYNKYTESKLTPFR